MELHCKILLYLDNRRIIIDMKNICEEFLKGYNDKISKHPPLRYLLEIDVMDLLNSCLEIGEALLCEPLKWQNICNEILFACLSSIDNEWIQHIKPSQIAVNLRLKCLSPLFVSSDLHFCGGIVCFKGLLIAISKPESYAYHTVWSCPEDCEDNEIILHYIPKLPPKCHICKSILFENSGLRRCGERVSISIKQSNNLLAKDFKIFDDLIPRLKLGSLYLVYATILKKVTSVWSLEELVPFPAPITTSIPKDIEELYQACKGKSWKFIYCLASSIGINVCPLHCFMHLKISLLLSLVSVKANQLIDSPTIHIFAAGYDTGFVGQLMTDAAKLAQRYQCVGTSNTMVPMSLIASSGGVCLMPLPFYTYNKKQVSSIFTAIESGKIYSDPHETKLRCAIWAQGMDYKKIILHNVGNVFGSICRGDYGEYNDEIVDFLLQRAMAPVKITQEEIKALRDLESYIDIIAGINVSLDHNTESLLKSYFLAARKESPKCVSIGSLTALATICLTSARLCRRSVANLDDAVFAIWLHASGNPEPRFVPVEYLETPADVNNLQKIFKQFKTWLAQFSGVSIP